MAYFKATTAFNIETIDLSSLIADQTGRAFFDNINEVTGDSNEQDIAAFQYLDGVTKTAYFGGAGFSFAANGTVKGGTVRAVSLYTGKITDFSKPDFVLNRLSVSALELVGVASTASTADDLALLAKVLGGDDRFLLSNFNDTLSGFAGNDEIFGYGGKDTLNGGAGNDVISGGDGDDVLIGGAGNDDLKGGAGIDTASYATATAAVTVDLRKTVAQATGGAGSDILTGIESLTGSTLSDRLDGNKAGNVLIGGAGSDTLNGYEGADRLVGGAGQDTLTGGTAADRFVFDASLASKGGAVFDTITDFNHAQGDRIMLSKAVFTGLSGAVNAALGEAAFFSGANATSAQDADDRLIYNTTTGALYYDADGTGTVFSAVQFAQIGETTHAALIAGDFLLIA